MHVLMPCLGNKIGKFNHKKVNDYIADKLVKTPKLYRGLTIEELLVNKFEVGKKIKFKRITSFSGEKFIAEEFACERYKTNVVIELNDAYAFDYSSHMCEILEKMIEDCDEDNDELLDKLYDDLGMVDYEREFFIPMTAEFTIKSIEFLEDRGIHLIKI